MLNNWAGEIGQSRCSKSLFFILKRFHLKFVLAYEPLVNIKLEINPTFKS